MATSESADVTDDISVDETGTEEVDGAVDVPDDMEILSARKRRLEVSRELATCMLVT